MNRTWIPLILVALTAAVLIGCQPASPGTTRNLGAVSYEMAFATAREVTARQYPIDTANPDTGVIECKPVRVQAPPERLLSRSPARHVTTVRVRREDGTVVASAAVAVQRQQSFVRRTLRPAEAEYGGPPHQTPGQLEAATTPEQNQTWETASYDHPAERELLQQIVDALDARRPVAAESESE